MWKQSLSDISCRKVIAIIFVYNFDMGQLSFTVNVVSNRFRSYYSLDKKICFDQLQDIVIHRRYRN